MGWQQAGVEVMGVGAEVQQVREAEAEEHDALGAPDAGEVEAGARAGAPRNDRGRREVAGAQLQVQVPGPGAAVVPRDGQPQRTRPGASLRVEGHVRQEEPLASEQGGVKPCSANTSSSSAQDVARVISCLTTGI